MSIDINGKVNLHNFFTIEIRDAKTNELKQTARAENIVLDQIYSRLVNAQSYFVNIHWGDGLGTPSPSRTTLFNHRGTKTATTVETIKSFPVSKWTRSITLGPEEYVNGQITEVGIAFGSVNTNLVTHAMLTDSEGNQLTLTKTDVDILTIYATVFIELGQLPEGYYWYNLPNDNGLVNYLTGGSINSDLSLLSYFNHPLEVQSMTGTRRFSGYSRIGTKTAVVSVDVANRKRNLNTVRFATTEGNGTTKYITAFNSFYGCLPNSSIFTPTPIENYLLGIGDGLRKEFDFFSASAENAQIKVNNNSISFIDRIKISGFRKVLDLTGVGIGGYGVAIQDDTIVTASNSSPHFTVHKFNQNTGLYEKLQDLTGVGIGGYGVAIQDDTIVTASNSSPHFTVHKFNQNTGLYEKVQDLVGVGTVGIGAAIQDDTIVTASNSSPLFTVHKLNQNTGLYEKVQDLIGVGNNGYGVAIQDDTIVTASNSSPLFTVHKLNQNTGLYEKVQDLTGVGSNGRGVAIQDDIIVTASDSSPYLTVHKLNQNTGLYEKLQDLTGVGIGGYGVAIQDDTIVTAFYYSPLFTVHKLNQNTGLYEKVQDLTGVGNNGYGVAIQDDTIVTASNSSPLFTVHKPIFIKSFELDSPPPVDAQVTIDCELPLIEKTTDYVLDVSASIQFGSNN